MPSDERMARRQPAGMPHKHEAILGAALAVFAQDGYTRASIDAIAARACVSTRTIYNHFACKAHVFQAVLERSTTGVADAQIAIIDRHLAEVTDLETDLVAFGRALARPMSEYAEHFALIRQIDAEASHIPQAALDTWREHGPERVRRALAGTMAQLCDHGLLDVPDADRAATHFMLLVQGAIPFQHGLAADAAGVPDAVASGVRAFLYGYLPATGRVSG